MITQLIVSNNNDYKKSESIYNQFKAITGLNFIDQCLLTNTPCDKFAIVYTNLNQRNLDVFVSLIKTYGYRVYSQKDFTLSLLNIFISGKIDNFKRKFQFEPEIDLKISRFLKKNIKTKSASLVAEVYETEYTLQNKEIAFGEN